VEGNQIPEPDALELCALKKTASPTDFAPGDADGSFVCEFGVVCDPPRRGLVVKLYIHGGNKIKRQTIDFGLFDNIDRKMDRIYQLTLADENTPCHRENGIIWRGSHEHIGNKNYKRHDLNGKSFQVVLDIFLQKTNIILEERIFNPFDDFELRP